MTALPPRFLFVFAALAASACDPGEGAEIGPDATLPDADPGNPDFPAPPEGEGVQLVMRTSIDAGREALLCRYLVLPDRPMDVIRFEHAYTAGSHHVLVYPTELQAADVATDGAVFDCSSRGNLHQTGVVYGGSEPEGTMSYPSGIGMRLAPASVVLLEAHYLNSSPEPLEADVRVNLWFADGEVETLAGTIFFYDWAIYLPPAPATAHAEMRCSIPETVSLLYSTSHMHRRGTAFSAELEPEGDGPTIPLHATSGAGIPTPVGHAPPVEVPAGSTIHFSCDYQNDRDAEVIEGESIDGDEMCIYIASYYPKLPESTELCQDDGSGPVLDGDQTCAEVVDCMLDAGVGNWVAGQACVTDTCTGSAAALSSFVVCVDEHDCWGSESCVAARCLAPWNACQAAGCSS